MPKVRISIIDNKLLVTSIICSLKTYIGNDVDFGDFFNESIIKI